MKVVKLTWKSPYDGTTITEHVPSAPSKKKKKREPVSKETKPKVNPSVSFKRISKGFAKGGPKVTSRAINSRLKNKDADGVGAPTLNGDDHDREKAKPLLPPPPVIVVPRSPNTALRAARLRLQYSHTFCRNRPEGKFVFEEEQQREIRRLEAVVGTCGVPEKKENTVKTKREKDREEARMNIEKMESTVLFEDSLSALNELKEITGYYDPIRGGGRNFNSPLVRVGLVLKPDECTLEVAEFEGKDVVMEEEDSVGDEELEEGEIAGDVELEEGEVMGNENLEERQVV